MNWPMPQDYNEAIQNPALAFTDGDLRSGEVAVGPLGVPLPRSGNFADVYQVRGVDGRNWAVKCFTRPVVGLGERYARVGETLARTKLPFTVTFTYLTEGIRVAEVWRPAVKMEWVEGLLLNQVVRENAGRPHILAALVQMWVKLCRRLRDVAIAHADLQHGNVLLVPGARAGAYELKLIDYDGMFVPALANTPTGETGHSAYRHPDRNAGSYSPDLDRFPHLVVATALKALEVGGQALWARYDTGDNLLFTEKDFQNPAGSKLMREMWGTGNPAVRAFVGRLAIACSRPIPQTPWLDEIAPDGEPVPLDLNANRDAEIALGFASPLAVVIPLPPLPSDMPVKPVKPSKPSKPTGTVAPPKALPVEARVKPLPLAATVDRPWPTPETMQEREGAMELEEQEAEGKPSLLPWAIAGVLAIVAVIGGAIAFSGSRRIEPIQQNPEDRTEVADVGSEKEKPKLKVDAATTKKLDTAPLPREWKPSLDPPLENPIPKDPAPPVERVPVAITARAPTIIDTQGKAAKLYIDENSRTVLLGSERTGLIVLDLATGTIRQQQFAWFGLTGGDTFCPLDRGRVARCSPDEKEVLTWEVKAGKSTEKYTIPDIPPGVGKATHKYVHLSPDARYLVVARTGLSDGDKAEVPFRLFDTNPKTGKTLLSLEWTGGSTYFNVDSMRILVAEASGRFRWFKLPGGEPDGEWNYGPPGPEQTHTIGGISGLGHTIGYNGPAKTGMNLGPCLVDGQTGEVIHRFGAMYDETSAVVLSADGRFAALLRTLTKTEAIVDVVTVSKGEPIARATVPIGGSVPTFALSSSGDKLLVHDPKTGKLFRFDVPVGGTP